MRFKKIASLIKDAASEWSNDKASSFGAALSYYTVFSFPPLLLITASIAGLIFGEEASKGQITAQFQGLLGREGAQMIETMIQNSADTKKGILAGIIGAGLLLLGASGVFIQLQTALNFMWGVKSKPRSGIKHFIFTRLLSFAMVISIGFLLLVSLTISSLLSAFGNYLTSMVTGSEVITGLIHAANFILSFAVITFLFALIYKFLPDVKINWRDVWFGAVSTAFLFTVGKYAIGFYLGHSKVGSAYGAAGSLAIVLVWIYYSSQILFFGAEFTQVYANRYGSRIIPTKEAVLVEQKEVPPEEAGHKTGDGGDGRQKDAEKTERR